MAIYHIDGYTPLSFSFYRTLEFSRVVAVFASFYRTLEFSRVVAVFASGGQFDKSHSSACCLVQGCSFVVSCKHAHVRREDGAPSHLAGVTQWYRRDRWCALSPWAFFCCQGGSDLSPSIWYIGWDFLFLLSALVAIDMVYSHLYAI